MDRRMGGGKPVIEESSRIPAFPASATASMVSRAFRSDFIYLGGSGFSAAAGKKTASLIEKNFDLVLS